MDIPAKYGQKLYPLTHFLGYRPEHSQGRTRFLPEYRDKPWVKKAENVLHTGIATWVGLVLLALVSRAAPFHARNVPIIIGSFGAEVVLLYAAHTSPMAQPRNIIIAMPLSAVIGIGIAKAFANQASDFGQNFPAGYSNNWAAPATAVVLSLMVTQTFSIPHPPGGATAILPTVNIEIFNLGWFYVGYVMTQSAIMLGWGLIVNNIGRRRYPQYWITPAEVSEEHKSEKQQLHTAPGSAQTSERLA